MLVAGGRLARNTVLNFIGQLLPMVAAIPALPYTIRGLGTERFGVLAIAFVVLGYFALFDFGLGRATTKYVAEALGHGDQNRIPRIIWTSLLFVLLSGSAAGVGLYCTTPVLIAWIHISPQLLADTTYVFHVLCLSILVALLSASLNGVLEAYQRFDLINLLRIPSSILTYTIPAIVLLSGGGLRAIVVLLLLKNLLVTALQLALCVWIVPEMLNISFDLALAPALFGFGGWIFMTDAVVMLLMYLDRLMVASMVSMSAVTYYAGPYELINRAGIVPSSMVMVLFPAVSCLQATNTDLNSLTQRAFRYLIVGMGLITAFVIAFAPVILSLWLGQDFLQSTFVLRVFAIGVFLSSLAWLAGTLLQASGAPRVVTVIHVIQLPFYVATTWAFIKIGGIDGAAVSWSLRMLLSVVFLFEACRKRGLISLPLVVGGRALKFLLVTGVLSALTASTLSWYPPNHLMVAALEAATFSVILVFTVWKYTLDEQDRSLLGQTIGSQLADRRG
jgi:O-antigen/teichoic acid export membrane protein